MAIVALLVKVTFFEAFFKVHYTKGFRLTYPLPLPTSVAGMFGALLGIERHSMLQKMKGYLFGSKLLSHKGLTTEQATYIQKIASAKPRRGVEGITIIIEPTYIIAMAGREDAIKKFEKNLLIGYRFLPYGGQNDFFLKDLSVLGIRDVQISKVIENYAPRDFVQRIEFKRGTMLETLPVVHFFEGISNMFYFIENGQLILKEGRELPCVEGIGLYEIDKFRWVLG